MPTLDKMELQEQTFLRGKFSHLIHWEKAKKRERVLVAALSYSLLVSLVFLPLQGYLPPRYAFLSFPPLFFILFALGFSVARPWRERESVRTVSFLDKVLHLQERALTAWEILGRKENGPAERMVLEETAEKLRRLEPQTLFRRQLSWHVYLVPPLLLFWTILLWLDVGFRFDWSRTSTVVPLAQKLSEFSQDLEEKSKAGELEESARMAQALEEIAAKGLREEVGLEELRDNLASMVSRVERGTSSLGRDASRSFADFSSGDLSGLMAELNEFQDSLVLPDSTAGKGLSASDLFQQLSTFPLLKEELEKVLSSIQNLNRESIRDFLRRTERGARSELDRRSLQGVREYLLQLLNEINDKEVSGLSQNFALPRPEGSLPDKKGQGRGSRPGDQPGAKTGKLQAPRVQARAMAHLKGLLKEGPSAGFTFRGEAQGGESEIPRKDVVVNYQRQMESDLASEEIPQELKETIKKYFLSLGVAKEKITRRD